MKSIKIKATSVDKVNGKLVKYKKGDCLSIDCKNGNYIAAFISDKFSKYYDFTLLEYYDNVKPNLNNFLSGRFWGTRFDSSTYGVDKKMITCKYVDNIDDIEIMGHLSLIVDLGKASYSYCNDVTELLNYYIMNIQKRVEKTKNAEAYPSLSFHGEHLIETKDICTSMR